MCAIRLLKEIRVDKKLLEILVCPLCKGKLLFKKQELICKFDRLAFPVRDDIPVMLEQEARLIPLEEKDKL
ncbi:tetraacyldisaccharide 4'-kinase [Legionella pneumophila]|nr:Trm112 family protein [Legionella pneumophila]AOU13790.1 tetraacyldisaccharide 4'-kinase [Legionella pneumophila]